MDGEGVVYITAQDLAQFMDEPTDILPYARHARVYNMNKQWLAPLEASWRGGARRLPRGAAQLLRGCVRVYLTNWRRLLFFL
jgi:hypothetical protein